MSCSKKTVAPLSFRDTTGARIVLFFPVDWWKKPDKNGGNAFGYVSDLSGVSGLITTRYKDSFCSFCSISVTLILFPGLK